MTEIHKVIIIALLFSNIISYHWGKYVEDYKIKKFLLTNRFHEHLYWEYKEWVKENEE